METSFLACMPTHDFWLPVTQSHYYQSTHLITETPIIVPFSKIQKPIRKDKLPQGVPTEVKFMKLSRTIIHEEKKMPSVGTNKNLSKITQEFPYATRAIL